MFRLGSNKPSFSVAKTIKYTRGSESATNMQTVEASGGVSLRKKSEAAGVSLKKKNMDGVRAQVVLVIDHSGSMRGDYASGKVQELVERVLAFGLQVDVDGTIPVIPFDNRVHKTIDVTMTNYQNIVQNEIYKPGQMGGTEYEGPLKEVRELAKKTDDPIFLCFLTDGDPWNHDAATQLVCDLSRYPVFIKFLSLRDVPYLQMLDDLGNDKRLLDNVDTKVFTNLNMDDEAFADAMVDEWDSWTVAARNAGILE